MRKFYCLFSLIIFFVLPVKSQYLNDDRYLSFGIKGGASISSISNIYPMIISENTYPNYGFDEKTTVNPYASLFVNYKLEGTVVALEGGLSYYQIASKSEYSDETQGFNDKFKFQYDYIALEAYLRSYCYKGFNVAVGLRFGFNVTPNNIKYSSNKESIYGPDIKVEQRLKQALKGKNNIAPCIILGYESPKGWLVDLSCHYGLNDVIETRVNDLNIMENTNNTHSIQLTVGWLFSLNKSKF